MSLAVGSRIGPYEILASLGAGGMGEVYRARDPRLDRAVAVKVLASSPGATPVELERFQREARAIARLSHPNICTIHDVGRENGVAYLVMELLEGETLAERLERGPVPLDRALALSIQIAEALDASHGKGVIHRDLKPSNIFLVARSATEVKLLDFGLAKFRDNDYADDVREHTKSLWITDDGGVLGTRPYMAPEQVEGRGADARTDIFALGVVLYEMTTGRAPFHGKSRASLTAAILTHHPPPVSTLAAMAPASLDRIVTKCLCKDPDDRWQSARDLASALRWSLDDDPAQLLAAASTTGRRRPRLMTVLPALVAAVAVSASAVWAVTGGRLGGAPPPPVPRFIPVTFRAGTVTGARFTPDGDTVIYSAAWGTDPYALFMTRRDSVESRRLDVLNAKLLGVSSTGELAFLRGPHDALKLLAPGSGTLVRVSIAGGGPREILDDVIAADWRPGSNDLAIVRGGEVEFPLGTRIHGPQGFRQVRIAPDGQRLALVEGQGRNIVLMDRTGRTKTLSSGWDDLTTLAWSPSGDEVWFAASRRDDSTTSALRAVSTDGRERVIFRSPSAVLSIHDVFSDGRVLLSTHVARMGCSCVTPLDTQPRDLSWLDGPAPEALSADGRTVLLGEMLRGGGAAGAIYLRRTDGSDAVRLSDGYPEDLSPDGKWVLATARVNRQQWTILPTGPGSPRTLPPGPLIQRFEANFLPDGRRIVFGGREKDQGRRIYLQDIESGTIRAISPERVATAGLATNDGRFVVGTHEDKHFLFPVDGGAPVPLSNIEADDDALQWSSDGRLLYVRKDASWPPIVDRVDIATGHREPWKTIQPADPVGVDSVFRILVTPDGKTYCHDYVRFVSQLFIVEGLK